MARSKVYGYDVSVRQNDCAFDGTVYHKLVLRLYTLERGEGDRWYSDPVVHLEWQAHSEGGQPPTQWYAGQVDLGGSRGIHRISQLRKIATVLIRLVTGDADSEIPSPATVVYRLRSRGAVRMTYHQGRGQLEPAADQRAIADMVTAPGQASPAAVRCSDCGAVWDEERDQCCAWDCDCTTVADLGEV